MRIIFFPKILIIKYSTDKNPVVLKVEVQHLLVSIRIYKD